MNNTLMRLLKIFICICTAMCMTSCSLLSPVRPASTNRYLIKKVPADIKHHRKHRRTMLVLPIESRPLYNTTQMAYSTQPYQVAYFAQNEWVETPAQMLLPLVVQTLQKTNYYKAIVTAGYAGSYDYALYLQLLNAKDDFTDSPPAFDLTVRAQILSVATGKILATKIFFISEPLLYNRPYSGVVAANRAGAEFLRRLAIFCVRNTR